MLNDNRRQSRVAVILETDGETHASDLKNKQIDFINGCGRNMKAKKNLKLFAKNLSMLVEEIENKEGSLT